MTCHSLAVTFLIRITAVFYYNSPINAHTFSYSMYILNNFLAVKLRIDNKMKTGKAIKQVFKPKFVKEGVGADVMRIIGMHLHNSFLF